ncbi:MAG: hypothetical protein KDI42_10570, partial [Gammaproteobacteria bacterium]|nr:hypothetical protein [Gammaproteobacteria bacterium]
PRTWLTPFLGALMLCCWPVAQASGTGADIVVITNGPTEIRQFSRAEVADLFLGRSQNAYNVLPVDQDDEALRERFYREYAGMSLSRVRAYWAKRVFTGRGRPPDMISLDQTAGMISGTRLVITYMPAGKPMATVDAVRIDNTEDTP